MSDVSPRRRTLGRLLLAGGALALPLTASISYASAQDSAPQAVPPVPSDAPQAPLPPVAPQVADVPPPPLPPQPPQAPGEQRHMQRFMLRHQGDPAIADDDFGPGEHHQFVMRIDGPMTAEQKKQFEKMRKEWEKNGAKWKAQAGEWQKMAQEHRKMEFALADNIPQVSSDCGQTQGSASRSWTDKDGHQHVVICERMIRDQARMGEEQARMAMPRAMMGLRGAREMIANNADMSASVKQEVLADLDREIARLEAEQK